MQYWTEQYLELGPLFISYYSSNILYLFLTIPYQPWNAHDTSVWETYNSSG